MIAAIARAVATAVVVVALSVLCLIGLAAWLVVSTRADRQRARQVRERARQAREAKAAAWAPTDAELERWTTDYYRQNGDRP